MRRECFEDVDVNENGNAIIPPFTSIFQQDDVVSDILPPSKWNSGPASQIPLLSTTPFCSESTDKAAPRCKPNGEPTSGLHQDSEGAIPQADSVSEGASHDTLVPFVDHSMDSNLVPEVPANPIGNNHSDTTRPWRNVGNYKQGPAKIRRLPIDGEEYDFSFSAISEWDQLVPIIANRGNIQTKYYPQQRIQKSFLAECYLLQDCWADDPHCVRSQTGYVICISDCPVLWTSKLQSEIALLTMEAEYVALSSSCRDLFPLIDITQEICSALLLTPPATAQMHIEIHEDNVGALILGQLEPRRMTPRSKHYAVKYHWFCEHLAP